MHCLIPGTNAAVEYVATSYSIMDLENKVLKFYTWTPFSFVCVVLFKDLFSRSVPWIKQLVFVR